MSDDNKIGTVAHSHSAIEKYLQTLSASKLNQREKTQLVMINREALSRLIDRPCSVGKHFLLSTYYLKDSFKHQYVFASDLLYSTVLQWMLLIIAVLLYKSTAVN